MFKHILQGDKENQKYILTCNKRASNAFMNTLYSRLADEFCNTTHRKLGAFTDKQAKKKCEYLKAIDKRKCDRAESNGHRADVNTTGEGVGPAAPPEDTGEEEQRRLFHINGPANCRRPCHTLKQFNGRCKSSTPICT